MKTEPHHDMLIKWSDEDQAYVVYLPDFPHVSQPTTHGATYEIAARHGHEVLETLLRHVAAGEIAPPTGIGRDKSA